MTNTIRIEVSTDSMTSALHELSALMSEAQRARDTTSSTTDYKYMHSSELESMHVTAFTKGYNEGLRDAQSEHAQERVMAGNNTLPFMLAHDEVMVCMEPGRAPFPFKPMCMTTFGKLPKLLDVPEEDASGKLPNYQRELIGTPPGCVGMYGTNLVTQRPMFIVRVDHWTLCPKTEPKPVDSTPASE